MVGPGDRGEPGPGSGRGLPASHAAGDAAGQRGGLERRCIPRARAALMATTAERIRHHSGPAVLSYGFRPFFLLAALWAALAVAIWLPVLAGSLVLPSAFSPLEWHVHELAYGYVPAVAAGFLLTAVPNWTGRLPVTGTPLLALASL